MSPGRTDENGDVAGYGGANVVDGDGVQISVRSLVHAFEREGEFIRGFGVNGGSGRRRRKMTEPFRPSPSQQRGRAAALAATTATKRQRSHATGTSTPVPSKTLPDLVVCSRFGDEQHPSRDRRQSAVSEADRSMKNDDVDGFRKSPPSATVVSSGDGGGDRPVKTAATVGEPVDVEAQRSKDGSRDDESSAAIEDVGGGRRGRRTSSGLVVDGTLSSSSIELGVGGIDGWPLPVAAAGRPLFDVVKEIFERPARSSARCRHVYFHHSLPGGGGGGGGGGCCRSEKMRRIKVPKAAVEGGISIIGDGDGGGSRASSTHRRADSRLREIFFAEKPEQPRRGDPSSQIDNNRGNAGLQDTGDSTTPVVSDLGSTFGNSSSSTSSFKVNRILLDTSSSSSSSSSSSMSSTTFRGRIPSEEHVAGSKPTMAKQTLLPPRPARYFDRVRPHPRRRTIEGTAFSDAVLRPELATGGDVIFREDEETTASIRVLLCRSYSYSTIRYIYLFHQTESHN